MLIERTSTNGGADRISDETDELVVLAVKALHTLLKAQKEFDQAVDSVNRHIESGSGTPEQVQRVLGRCGIADGTIAFKPVGDSYESSGPQGE